MITDLQDRARGMLAMMSLSVVLLAACQSNEEPMDIAELTEFATRYAEAWSSQNPAALASFYTDNGSLTVNNGEPSVGRDAVEQTAREYMTAFPDMVSRRHPVPDLVEVVFQVPCKIFDRLVINSSRSLVRFDAFVRFPNHSFWDLVRLASFIGSSHCWLTSFQSWMTQPLCSSPITGESTLLLAGPSLLSASVLGSLWVLHLDFSLGIGEAGSHVPRRSLCQVHAAFMPVTA